MIKIAICDDEQHFLREIKLYIEQFLLENKIDFEIDAFSLVKNLVNSTNSTYYDMIFLDIELNDANGIDVGQCLRDQGYNGKIVFVTSHVDYMQIGYSVAAYRYVLKSDLESQLSACIKDFLTELKNRFLQIKGQALLIADIVYIESENHKVQIHLADKTCMEFYCKLSDVETNISTSDIVRIHQSYLVNLSYVDKIKRYDVLLRNGIILPVSKSRYKEINNKYQVWRRL